MKDTLHILTCLSGAPSNEKVVRFAASLARGLGGTFTALYVEVPGGRLLRGASGRRLQKNTALAESFGAHLMTVYGADAMTQVAEYAYRSGVTHIVMGESSRLTLFGTDAPRRLARLAPEVQICVVPGSGTGSLYPAVMPVLRPLHLSLRDTIRCLGLVALSTLVGELLKRLGLPLSSIGQVYILGVLATGLVTTGWAYGVMGALMSVLAYNFFFVPPLFSFLSLAPGYPVTFLVMLVVGLITSDFTLRVRGQAMAAGDKAWRTEVLLKNSSLLQKSTGSDEALNVLCTQMQKLLGRSVRCFIPDERGELTGAWENELEKEAALWAWQRRKSAGAGAEAFSGAQNLYLPVMGEKKTYAVVALALGKGPNPEPFVRNVLGAMVEQCGLTLEKYALEQDRDAARRKAEQEKLRANLLRSISHDLRTPLTSICGSAGVLRENGSALNEEKRQQLYTDIYDDALWLIELVENLLAVTRIENGTMTLHTEPQLVEDIFAEAMEHLDRHAAEHHIETSLPEELLMAEMDSGLMVQVLVNLLNNAIKYTPEGSHILLSAAQEGSDWVRISVADDGPGIPETERGKLFEMFYSGGNRGGDGRRGMGLGLSLCRSIVTAHGGTIEVRENPPHGSLFTFTLKRKEAADLESE